MGSLLATSLAAQGANQLPDQLPNRLADLMTHPWLDQLARPLAPLLATLGPWLKPPLLLWTAALSSLPTWLQEPARGLPWLLLAMVVLVVLLGLGRAIGHRLQLRLVGIPEALVAGLLGLALAPSGLVPLFPAPVMQLWADLPVK